MKKVFISHSSAGDSFSARVRNLVRDGLRGKGYEVLVDTDVLKPGQEWCPVLYEWLAECHAAIVLLNNAALASSWVRREVNILMWRRALTGAPYVVPALVGDVGLAEVRAQGFGDIAPLHMARSVSDAAPERRGEALAESILERFAEVPDGADTQDSMRRWLDQIAGYLQQVTDDDRLVEMGRRLDIGEEDLGRLRLPVGADRYLAYQLLGSTLQVRLDSAVWEIVEYLRDDLRLFLTLIAPTWVDGEIARKLLPSVQTPQGFVVALNLHDQRIGRQHLYRAFCGDSPRYRYRTAGGQARGENGRDELLAECLAAVRKLAGLPSYRPIEAAHEHPRPGVGHYLIIKTLGARAETVGWVSDRSCTTSPGCWWCC